MNRKALPKQIDKPIIVYYKVARFDDRAYIVYPNGRVNDMCVWDRGRGFGNTAVINNPGQGYKLVRKAFQARYKRGWKMLHWEYL